MKKSIILIGLGLLLFTSAFAFTTKITKSSFGPGECQQYCQDRAGGGCLTGCTVSYDANGKVLSVDCSWGKCSSEFEEFEN